MQKQRTGNPVNRWPTEETLLGAFFDVTNPMKVGGGGPATRTGQLVSGGGTHIANFGSG
jgi:Na+-translocating ferredoxin:NAD+ oxidoreductase RnfD subunit